MTSTEPKTYKPGQELDEQIALKVMGWKRGHGITWITGRRAGQLFQTHKLPPFSTTWEGMRLVVEEMQRRGWEWAIGQDGNSYTAVFSDLAGGRGAIEENAETAPHAVCLAALSTLQHVSEELDGG